MNSAVKRRLVTSLSVITSPFLSIPSSGTQTNRCFLSVNLSLYCSLLLPQSGQVKGKTTRSTDLDFESPRLVEIALSLGRPNTRTPGNIGCVSCSRPLGVLFGRRPFQAVSVSIVLALFPLTVSVSCLGRLLFCLFPLGGACALSKIPRLQVSKLVGCLGRLDLQKASDSRLSVQSLSLSSLLLAYPAVCSGSRILLESSIVIGAGLRLARKDSAYQAAIWAISALYLASSAALTASLRASCILIQSKSLPQFLPFAFFLRSLFASRFVRVLSRSLFSSGPGFLGLATGYRISALPLRNVASGIACTYGVSTFGRVGVGAGSLLVISILVSLIVATVSLFGSSVCFVFFFCLFALLDCLLDLIASRVSACRCSILFYFFAALSSSFFAALAQAFSFLSLCIRSGYQNSSRCFSLQSTQLSGYRVVAKYLILQVLQTGGYRSCVQYLSQYLRYTPEGVSPLSFYSSVEDCNSYCLASLRARFSSSRYLALAFLLSAISTSTA